jgi:hypothetical protein
LKPVDQLGDSRAGPGPLAGLLQAFLVDVDDANGSRLVRPRSPALVLVKCGVSKHLEGKGVEEKQDGTENNGKKRAAMAGLSFWESFMIPSAFQKGRARGVNVV